MWDSRKEKDSLALLTELLAIPSVNSRDDEGAVAAFVRGFFEARGIRSEVLEIDGTHANVSAFLPGRDSSVTMIWNGHLDTVPYGAPEAWHTDPAVPSVRDGRVYGRGASDMKGGLAAMVFALCDLKERGVMPACNILFLGTCDEEKGGLGAEAARSFIREQVSEDKSGLPGRSFLLVGEPTFLRPGIAQKGCLWLELKVKGHTSHGAYPGKGLNAIDAGMRLAQRIAGYVAGFAHPVLGKATAQVTRISGGVANNMTPDACSIVMDIRMVPGLTAGMVLAEGQRALEEERQRLLSSEDGQKKASQLKASFDILNERRAIEIAPDHAQVDRLARLLEEAACDTAPIGINFFTDASILDRDDEMDVCLFGPGDPAMAHQPDEYVEIDRYYRAVQILEAFAVGE